MFRDWYTTKNTWYYVVQIAAYIFAAGLIADLVQVMNLYVPEHNFQRVMLTLTNVKYLMPVFIMAAVLFRRSFNWSVLWFSLIVSCWAIGAFVLFGWGIYYSSANKKGAVGNVFNDPLWCCAPEVYSNAEHGCPNTEPCTCPTPPEPCPHIPTSVSELRVPRQWLARFWVDFLYLLYHSAVVAFFAWRLAGLARLKGSASATYNTDGEDKKD